LHATEKQLIAQLESMEKPPKRMLVAGNRTGVTAMLSKWRWPECEVICHAFDLHHARAIQRNLCANGFRAPITIDAGVEIFTMEELIQAFSLERCSKSGAKFNVEKTKWFNHEWLMRKSNEEVGKDYQAWLKEEKNLDVPLDFAVKVAGLVKDRVNFVKEIWDQSFFFFEAPTEYDPVTVKKRWKENSAETMLKVKEVIKGIEPFALANIDETLNNWISSNELNMGLVMNGLRLMVVGAGKGPHIGEILELLGKEETLKRIDAGVKVLG